jgi:hypothetical protein
MMEDLQVIVTTHTSSRRGICNMLTQLRKRLMSQAARAIQDRSIRRADGMGMARCGARMAVCILGAG